MIKKKDNEVVPGFDIDKYDTSVLTKRTMAQIGGDDGFRRVDEQPSRNARETQSRVAG